MTVWVLGPSFRQPRSSTARCPKGRAGRRPAGGKWWTSEGGVELAQAMPEQLRIAVYLAAWCQLRRGEIRGLRRKDVDLAAGTLSVSVTKTTAMSGRTIVKEPKTRAGRRTIAVPAQIVNLLAAHLERFSPSLQKPMSLTLPTVR